MMFGLPPVSVLNGHILLVSDEQAPPPLWSLRSQTDVLHTILRLLINVIDIVLHEEG